MISAQEIEVFRAHDTHSLALLLEQKECFILYSTRRGLTGEWITDDEQRASLIKSELGRRGVFDGQ
jgi:hypothetical protein